MFSVAKKSQLKFYIHFNQNYSIIQYSNVNTISNKIKTVYFVDILPLKTRLFYFNFQNFPSPGVAAAPPDPPEGLRPSKVGLRPTWGADAPPTYLCEKNAKNRTSKMLIS